MPPDDDSEWVDSADRKVVLRALTEHRDEARLTGAEHDRRRELARTARTRGELRDLFADLPAPHPMIGGAGVDIGTSNPNGFLGLVLASGAVIMLLALAAGWWLPAVIFAVLLVLVWAGAMARRRR